MPKDKIPKLQAHECVAALRKRYKSPEWAFFEQVANGTGFADHGTKRRWADAIAVGIWPSRGCAIHGFEIKVYRADWMKELAKPAKAEAIQQYCDHWWIVAPRGLVHTPELPPTWGLIEVAQKDRLHTTVVAPKLEARALDRTFMAAVLRRHSEVYEKLVERETKTARAEGAARGDPNLASRLEQTQINHQKLQASVEEFEKASGIKIEYGWRLGDVGAAVRLLMNGEHRLSRKAQLEKDLEAYLNRCQNLRDDIAALDAVLPVTQRVGSPAEIAIAKAIGESMKETG